MSAETRRDGKSGWRYRLPALLLALSLLVGAGYALQRSVAHQLLEREGELTQQFLQSIVKAEESEVSLFAEPSPNESLISFVGHVSSLPGMLRLNVYSRDGIIRHSSEPNLVGKKFKDNEELAAAFTGKRVIQKKRVTQSEKSEHVALQSYGGELIEAYLPLVNGEGQVFAVVEFYRKPTSQ